MSHPQPSARSAPAWGDALARQQGGAAPPVRWMRMPRRSPARAKQPSSLPEYRAGQGRIQQKRIPGRRQAAASPAAEAPSGTQKKTARPTCFTALPPFCRKTKFVPCMNDSFRMGTHIFIIPLLSRFVNVTSGLFRAESEKIHFRGRKTHNLNIFGVFVRLHLRGRCDRIRENRGKCFPVNFRKE